MPTYRKLHTKALESQDIADMPDDFCRLTWLLLPLICSREGTTVYQAHYLCSKLYPLRSDVTDAMVATAFTWYEQHGMISPYTVDGRQYLWLPRFGHYQGICDKEAESPFPPVPDSLRQQVVTNSVPTLEQVKSNSTLEEKRRDVDTDVDSDKKRAAAPPASPSSFHRSALAAYQSTIGLVSGQTQAQEITTTLAELEERHIEDWWAKALTIAADQNKRSWAYVRGILRNCLAEGKPPGTNGNGREPPRGNVSRTLDTINQMIAEERAHGAA